MTDTTFPFAPDQVDDAAFDDGNSRRPIIIVGGIVAALVLGAGGYLLLGGGGGATNDSFVAPHVAGAAARAAAAAAKANAEAKPRAGTSTVVKKLPAAYNEQIGRDPFKALYVVPVVTDTGPAGVGASTVVGTLPGVSVPTASDPTTSSTATDTGTGTTPLAPVDKEYKLVLTRVYGTGTDRTGVFTVDGKQELAKIGTKFGPTSEIVLLSFQQGPKPGQWTTVLQVGDGDPFDVVSGVAAYVR